jgi:hypothetical protein
MRIASVRLSNKKMKEKENVKKIKCIGFNDGDGIASHGHLGIRGNQ